jgi:hypothetical protein
MTNTSIKAELAIIDLSRSESYEESEEEEVLFTESNLSSIYHEFFDNNDSKGKKPAKSVKNKLEDTTKDKKKSKDYSKLVSSDNDPESSDSDASNKDKNKDKDKRHRGIIALLDLRDISITLDTSQKYYFYIIKS